MNKYKCIKAFSVPRADEIEKLRRLIIENPSLPIVFCCSSDELTDYSWTFYRDFSCKIVTIYETDEKVFDHIIDITEYYQDIYDYEDMTKEEFDKKVQEEVENTTQYKAIRIFCK